jgi:isoamylase
MLKLLPGKPYPQGATWDGHGTNFAVWSEQASSVELCLDARAERPAQSLALGQCTDGVWHGYVEGVGPGQRYGYRVDGPYAPERGQRFNPHKLLIDPYARAISGPARWHELLAGFPIGRPDAAERDERDSAGVAPRAIVIDPSFDWKGDAPPAVPWRDSLVYECHVKGLTALHPEVPDALRGRYLGLASEPLIAHLRALGVTAVELLPIAHSYTDEFLVGRGLCNYWGYDGIGYFAPDGRFRVSPEPVDTVLEFKRMVRALHRAGIEVILDVVYNHSGEGSELGPTLSMRGFGNAAYYRLNPGDLRRNVDFTGCGNTLNLDHPQTLRLVTDSLRYWVQEMHVDGFRFDLAPALARRTSGLDVQSGFFDALMRDPVLARVKQIVEPWDVAGVARGQFARGYHEWNDLYRDQMRRFWKGEPAQVGGLAARLAGSADLLQYASRPPQASINFVACHDGFTLRDLTSYEHRHNDANGWQSSDGSSDNHSRNWGAEGPTDSPSINDLRDRVAASMLASLSFSLGVPMLQQGDELGRSQGGNNNPYGQDNEVTWMSWQFGPRERALLTRAQRYFALRRTLSVFRRTEFFDGNPVVESVGRASPLKDVAWLRPEGGEMQASDWQQAERTSLGMWICGHDAGGRADPSLPSHVLLFNAGQHGLEFSLPARGPGTRWRLLVDTSDRTMSDREIASAAIVVQNNALCLLEEVVLP